MPFIKVSELNENQLNWAVFDLELNYADSVKQWVKEAHQRGDHIQPYTTDWLRAGELIEKGKIVLAPNPSGGWIARSFMDANENYGDTPQIAIARCYLSSEIGVVVDIPANLVDEAIDIKESFDAASNIALEKPDGVVIPARNSKYTGIVIKQTSLHVLLSIGRQAAIYLKHEIDRIPEKDENVTIVMKDGKGFVTPAKQQSKDVSR